MEKILGNKIELQKVEEKIIANFEKIFNVNSKKISKEEFHSQFESVLL